MINIGIFVPCIYYALICTYLNSACDFTHISLFVVVHLLTLGTGWDHLTLCICDLEMKIKHKGQEKGYLRSDIYQRECLYISKYLCTGMWCVKIFSLWLFWWIIIWLNIELFSISFHWTFDVLLFWCIAVWCLLTFASGCFDILLIFCTIYRYMERWYLLSKINSL